MIYTVENTSRAGKRVSVSVNGNLVESPFYADTEKGIAHYYPKPLRVKRNIDEVYSRTLRGKVTVELMEPCE